MYLSIYKRKFSDQQWLNIYERNKLYMKEIINMIEIK